VRRRVSTFIRANARTAIVPAAIGGLVVAVLAAWLTAPRLSITGPSMVDDWAELRFSPLAFRQALHLSYDPALYDAGRYRPGFWAVWAQLQWHTLGAPDTMRGPNLWNLIRNGLFGLGLASVVVAAIRPTVRERIGPAWLSALAAIPGALVVSTPALARDFSRFGPQEPLLVGGMTLGLVLALAALYRWAAADGGKRGNAIVAAALGISGLLLWAVGVYQKEAAICAVLLIPFVVLELRDRWSDLGRIPRWAPFALVALLVAPLVQVFVEVRRISAGGTLIYGAAVPHSISEWYDRLTTALSQQWHAISGPVAAPYWHVIALVTPLLVLWAWWRTRRPPWLAIGLAVLALAVLVFQGVPLVAQTRYLIPPMGIVATAAVIAVAEAQLWLRAMVVAAAAVIVAVHVGDARDTARAFAAEEQAGVRLVSAATQLNPRRCPVYLASFDLERTYSLPELVALRGETDAACAPGYAGVLIASKIGGVSADDRILQACAKPGWQPLSETDLASILGCVRFKRTARGANGETVPVATVLDHDRLRIPASPFVKQAPDPAPLQPVQNTP
jgi:hypothetical protein